MASHAASGARAVIPTKAKFGISLQALLYRLFDLNVISQSYARSWWIRLNNLGWRKAEPAPLQAEQPMWLRRHVMRAVSEGALSHDEAGRILGEALPTPAISESRTYRDMMKKPLADRRRKVAAQAQRSAAEYAVDRDWLEMSDQVHED